MAGHYCTECGCPIPKCDEAEDAIEAAFDSGHERGFRVGTELGEMADEGAVNARLRTRVAELEAEVAEGKELLEGLCTLDFGLYESLVDCRLGTEAAKGAMFRAYELGYKKVPFSDAADGGIEEDNIDDDMMYLDNLWYESVIHLKHERRVARKVKSNG